MGNNNEYEEEEEEYIWDYVLFEESSVYAKYVIRIELDSEQIMKDQEKEC